MRRSLLAVGLITFFIAILGIDARATYGARVTADEPQYLLTALSLGEDANLDIADEIAAERYLPFHELPLNPQTIELDDAGQRLSPHDPGLPVLLAGPMRLGGWRFAKISLAVIAALTACATILLAVRRFAVSVPIAAVVTVGFFATPPLVGYATQVYPEMPAALAVVLGLGAVTGSDVSWRKNALAVVAVVVLPWLAVKYVPIAAVLGLALLRRTWIVDRANSKNRTATATLAVGSALLAMGVLYAVVHQRVYGGWTVYSAGDHFVDGDFQVVGTDPNYIGRSRRLVGLLVDREFGLLPWAPAYAFAVPAIVALVRRRSADAVVLIAVVAAGWSVATWIALTMHGWWWPGRQVVVILPAVVVSIAVLADRLQGLRSVIAVLSSLSLINWLWLVFEASTDRRTLIVDFAETSSPLYRLWSVLFPDHRVFGTGDQASTLLWLVVLAGFGLLAWRRVSKGSPAGQAAVGEAIGRLGTDCFDDGATSSVASGRVGSAE